MVVVSKFEKLQICLLSVIASKSIFFCARLQDNISSFLLIRQAVDRSPVSRPGYFYGFVALLIIVHLDWSYPWILLLMNGAQGLERQFTLRIEGVVEREMVLITV